MNEITENNDISGTLEALVERNSESILELSKESEESVKSEKRLQLESVVNKRRSGLFSKR